MALGVSANLDGNSTLFKWLESVKIDVREHWGELVWVASPFGTHEVVYGDEGEGPFAVIGFCLPDGVYADIENAYGALEGLRVYRDEAD